MFGFGFRFLLICGWIDLIVCCSGLLFVMAVCYRYLSELTFVVGGYGFVCRLWFVLLCLFVFVIVSLLRCCWICLINSVVLI